MDDPKEKPVVGLARANALPQNAPEDGYAPASQDLKGRRRVLVGPVEDGVVPADGEAGVDGLPTTSQTMAYNGATWDRIFNSLPVDGQAALKGLVTTAQNMVWNGVTKAWDRITKIDYTVGAPPLDAVPVVAMVGCLDPGTGNLVGVKASVPHDGLALNESMMVSAIGLAVGDGETALIRGITKFKTGKFTSAGSTALWTPASGKSFRLMRYKIDVTVDATQAAAGDLDVGFDDGATAMPLAETVYVGTAAGNSFFTSGWIDLGNGILSAVADNVLSVTLSAALATGTCRVLVAGTEE